jgi:hypothetical protein
MASAPASSYDCSFKVLLIGDSAVGKSSLLVSFVSASPAADGIAPTIGTHHDSTSAASFHYLVLALWISWISNSRTRHDKGSCCSCLELRLVFGALLLVGVK